MTTKLWHWQRPESFFLLAAPGLPYLLLVRLDSFKLSRQSKKSQRFFSLSSFSSSSPLTVSLAFRLFLLSFGLIVKNGVSLHTNFLVCYSLPSAFLPAWLSNCLSLFGRTVIPAPKYFSLYFKQPR